MNLRGVASLVAFCFTASVASAGEAAITLSSSAFKTGGEIPEEFSCKGGNVNPPLHIGNVPANAKSLAISVTDPDAPGGTFTHWLAWNLASGTSEIAQKGVPAPAVEGTNDFGKRGYGGPCPPSGTHRYYFRVFALDTTLRLRSGAKAAEFEKAIGGHVLGRG